MKKSQRQYLLLELECVKEVPDLADKVAGRAYTLDGCENASARLLDNKDAQALIETLDMWEKARAA